MEAVELILALYDDPDHAPELLKTLKERQQAKAFKVYDAAAICRDSGGRTTISDAYDLDAGHGSLFGAIVGGLVGLLGGPGGLVIGAMAGAATGGLVARATDLGFDQHVLDQVKGALKPGTSALLVMAEQPWADPIARVLAHNDARVFRNLLKDDLIRRLGEES